MGPLSEAAGPATVGSNNRPFTPSLLLGLALRPVPLALIQPALDALVAAVRRRHPDLLERVSAYADSGICIDPTDLPFVLLLTLDPARPRLTARRALEPGEASATIRGSLDALIALTDGKVDGDALFFTRKLIIEGDTEIVVALRNAIDGADIDLTEDLAATCGPLAGPVRSLIRVAAGVIGRLGQDMEAVRATVIAPALARAEMQSARIAAVERDVARLRRTGSGR